MNMIIKTAGVVLITLGSTVFGFLKSYSKRDYIDRLKAIDSALLSAQIMLNYGMLSRQKILSNAFFRVDGFTLFCDGAEIFDKSMSREINDALNGFLKDFGRGDIDTEQIRIDRVRRLLLDEISLKETEYKTDGKIWRTAGICAGLAVGIMLI